MVSPQPQHVLIWVGSRFALAEGSQGYLILGAGAPAPLQVFERSPSGWEQAFSTFQQWEPNPRPVEAAHGGTETPSAGGPNGTQRIPGPSSEEDHGRPVTLDKPSSQGDSFPGGLTAPGAYAGSGELERAPSRQPAPYQQNPYQQNPYQQNPYQQPGPYQQNPYQQNPYQQPGPYQQNPYQQPGPYGPPAFGVPPGNPYAQAARPAGIGVAGGIVGIIGTVLSLIPLLGIVLGLILGPIAIVLGAVGIGQSSPNATRPARPKGMAVTGLVLGILTVVFKLIPGVNLL